MRIKELNIIEFGGLCDRRFELSEGLNIFEGNNETGKSTLWLFIKFMLYGMPKKGHPEREKSINRLSHRAAGTMTVVFGGEEYRIERSFSENSRGKVDTYRVSDGEKVFKGEEPGEAMLGVPRDIFENSAAVGQSACAGLGGEKGAAAIRNLLSSADESVDVEKVQKKLNTLRVSYRHLNGKGGKLYEASSRISALEGRLSTAVDSRLKIAETEARLQRNGENIQKTENDLAGARDLTDRLGKREILQRFDRLAENQKDLEALKAKRDALVASETRGGYTPTAADGAQLSSLAESCERAKRTLGEAEARRAELASRSFTDEENRLSALGAEIERVGGAEAVIASATKATMKKTVGAFTFGVGAVLAIAFSALAFAFNMLFLIGAAVLLVAAVIGIIISAKGAADGKRGVLGNTPKGESTENYIKRCDAAYRVQQAHGEAMKEALADENNARRHYEYLFSDIEKALLRVSPDTPASIEGARAESERIGRFTEAYRALCGRIESIRAVIESDGAVLSVYDEAELRADMEGIEIPSMSLRQAEERRRYHEERLQLLKDKDSDLRTELINLKARSDDPTLIRDELSSLKESYADAEKFYDAVVLAIDGIERAASAMQGSITPAIGRSAGELIEKISGGRYGRVNMGRSLELTLVDGDGLTTGTDMMSGGMRDAAYLALRISLMQRIFDGQMPPFMMDEALCQLDGERMERMLSVIGGLCKEGCQCLLFTCHEREGDACRALGIDAKLFKMDVSVAKSKNTAV
ncbi:MAG: AAA family ATPase [Clostridia bacterium]|nr:AAA family ATPase [Clostridia bacterium]